MVMEYCDRGSLWHAMKQGLFHKRLSKTSVAVDLSAIVQVGADTPVVLVSVKHGCYGDHTSISWIYFELQPLCRPFIWSDTENGQMFLSGAAFPTFLFRVVGPNIQLLSHACVKPTKLA